MPSVTRKPQGNRLQRREEIEGRLLAAVEKLLAEGASYTEISVERLVSEAKVSRSTFYVYFEDKGALLEALTADVITDFMQAAAAWWDLPPGATREQVAAGIRRLIEVYRPHALLMGAVIEVSSYDSRVSDRFDEMVQRSIAEVARHIRAGQEEGAVRAELDPEVTAGWLTWMAERGLYELVRGAGERESELLAESLADIIWNTLYEGVRNDG